MHLNNCILIGIGFTICHTVFSEVAFSYSPLIINPYPVTVGSNVTLFCDFYSIVEGPTSFDWFKDGSQIFGIVRNGSIIEATRLFPESGVNVNLNESNGRELVLTSVNKTYSGEYACEISTHTPHFSKSLEHRYMNVIDNDTMTSGSAETNTLISLSLYILCCIILINIQ